MIFIDTVYALHEVVKAFVICSEKQSRLIQTHSSQIIIRKKEEERKEWHESMKDFYFSFPYTFSTFLTFHFYIFALQFQLAASCSAIRTFDG